MWGSALKVAALHAGRRGPSHLSCVRAAAGCSFLEAGTRPPHSPCACSSCAPVWPHPPPGVLFANFIVRYPGRGKHSLRQTRPTVYSFVKFACHALWWSAHKSFRPHNRLQYLKAPGREISPTAFMLFPIMVETMLPHAARRAAIAMSQLNMIPCHRQRQHTMSRSPVAAAEDV